MLNLRTLAALAIGLTAAHPALSQPNQRYDRELRGIKGNDDRIEVAATQFPWSAVGRLNNGLGAHCTGTLVGRRLVVTAAHCLWNRRTQAIIPVTSLTFVAGYDRGQYLKASKIERMHPAPGWNFSDPGGLDMRVHDWAVLELAEPLGDEVGWVAPGAQPKEGMAVVAAGYGKDKAHIPTAHLGCHLLQQRGGLFLHDCDAVQGDSGGPIFSWLGGEPRLVGVNVAVLVNRGDTGVAIGVEALKGAAMKLGAQTGTRAGPLSAPLDPAVRVRAEGR